MFVQQTKMSVLNVPCTRVGAVYRSVTDIQLALPDLPAQMASAYMVVLKGGSKVQVLVGLFMATSLKSLFYLSDMGEVPVDKSAEEIEAGLEFAESMGFVLQDMEFERMTPTEQELYWSQLPICRRQEAEVPAPEKPAEPRVPPTPPPPTPTPSSAAEVVKTAKTAKPPAASVAPERRDTMRFSLATDAFPQRSTATPKEASVSTAVPSAVVSQTEHPVAAAASSETVEQALASLRPQSAKVDVRALRQQLKEHLGRLLASL